MIKVRICYSCGINKDRLKRKPITWKVLFVCFDCGCQMNIGFKVWRSGKKRFIMDAERNPNSFNRSLVNDKESELEQENGNKTEGV